MLDIIVIKEVWLMFEGPQHALLILCIVAAVIFVRQYQRRLEVVHVAYKVT